MSIEYVKGGYSIFVGANGTKKTIGKNLSPWEAISAIKAFGQIN